MDKEARYDRIYIQLRELLKKTENRDARLSTVAAVLHHKLGKVLWTGFYMLTEGELIVKTYQGPIACQVLEKNKGVCWAGINQKKTIVVPDVRRFEGHITCDSRSMSEIVVPVWDRNGAITGVLDVDSTFLNRFDETDKEGLEKIIALLID